MQRETKLESGPHMFLKKTQSFIQMVIIEYFSDHFLIEYLVNGLIEVPYFQSYGQSFGPERSHTIVLQVECLEIHVTQGAEKGGNRNNA